MKKVDCSTFSLLLIPWSLVPKLTEHNGQNVFLDQYEPYDFVHTHCTPDWLGHIKGTAWMSVILDLYVQPWTCLKFVHNSSMYIVLLHDALDKVHFLQSFGNIFSMKHTLQKAWQMNTHCSSGYVWQVSSTCVKWQLISDCPFSDSDMSSNNQP